MKYKLVALDLDDTVLRSDRTVSEHTKSVIKAAVDSGCTVVIATGRPFAGTKQFCEMLGIYQPAIVNCGAQVVDARTEKILHTIYIDHDMAVDVERFLRSYGCYHQIYGDLETFLCEHYDMHAQLYEHMIKIPHRTVGDFLELENIETPKFLCIDFSNRIRLVNDEAYKRYGARFKLGTSRPIFLEIYNAEAHKGAALKRLAEGMGLGADEVIAIGDSNIDLTMIEYAGLGIAMGNAIPSVKEIADVTAPSNDEDGVAWALNEYVLM